MVEKPQTGNATNDSLPSLPTFLLAQAPSRRKMVAVEPVCETERHNSFLKGVIPNAAAQLLDMWLME